MPDRVLVTTGMKCPRPLFEVHKTIKEMDLGSVLEVQADDPAFKLDIEAWCKRTGNELIDLMQDSGRYIASIKKIV